jgi:hypothetical protein
LSAIPSLKKLLGFSTEVGITAANWPMTLFMNCPVPERMKIIGGKWKPIILYLICHDVNRFGEMMTNQLLPELGLPITNNPLKGLIMVIQLFLILPFRLYLAVRFDGLFICQKPFFFGNVSFNELNTSLDKLSLIKRLNKLPPASISKKPIPNTIM